MTTIVAKSDLYNPLEYGRVREGHRFTVRDHVAQDLIAAGNARPLVIGDWWTADDVKVQPVMKGPCPDLAECEPEPPALTMVRIATRACCALLFDEPEILAIKGRDLHARTKGLR